MIMKINILILASLLALTGCSGQEEIPNAATAPMVSQPTPEGALGKMETNVKELKKDIPEVDNGTMVTVPSADVYEVETNEKVLVSAGGLPPNTEADIYIMYNLNGDNSAVLNITSVKVAGNGSVNEFINIPKALQSGTFALVIETNDGLLYNAALKIKE